ncbi:MAG: sigma-70 family RNA polymerase sigma factor [bacterium]|nr:sigma-70 family RNA polymerase sigma factor [bacterium]
MSLDHWVNECREGRTRAYAEIVRELRPRLLDYLYRMLQNRELAEEIGQEAFLKAYQQLQKFNPAKASFTTWLFTLGRNLCIDTLRRMDGKRLDQEPSSTLLALNPIPRDQAWENELENEIAHAVAQLDVLFRDTFILREYQGLEIEEIAQITNTNLGTVKSRLFRARQSLQLALKPVLQKAGIHYG